MDGSGSTGGGPAGRELRGLIPAGFDNRDRAEKLLESPEFDSVDLAQLLRQMTKAPDPDQALILLVRLIERAPKVAELIGTTQGLRLIRLLGASEALGEFLIRRPENADMFLEPEKSAETVPALRFFDESRSQDELMEYEAPAELRELLLKAVDADPAPAQQEDGTEHRPVAGVTGKEAAIALRSEYRRQITALATADLMSPNPQEAQPLVSRWLADLAAAALETALAVARAELAEKYDPALIDSVDLVVVAMGKAGARELNYVSDVDVIYAHDIAENPAVEDITEAQAGEIAQALATKIARIIQGPAPEAALWEVDANLRPEGKDGALSRTVASHKEYYQRWAHTWEFQAQLKARPIAGSMRVGQRYLGAIQPMVWQASGREGFVGQVYAMRRRVVDNIDQKDRDREIKLGPGGLREVEFPAQLLQLVHGRTDETLHVKSTEEALKALSDGGYIGRSDSKKMAENYRFLRLLEHRIQLVHMRRTHLMPAKERAQWVLARSVRPLGGTEPADAKSLVDMWKATVRSVTGLFEQIFYRPLLPETAALPADQARLAPDAAKERLAALGYRDPAGATRHIASLTEGVSRRARLQRQILPAMIGWLAEGPDPDGGLLGFRKLSDSHGTSGWYLRMLRDSSDAAERLSTVLSSSRYISDMLEHFPEGAAWLDRDADLQPVSLDAQITEMRSVISRHPETAQAIRVIRMIRRREILRTAMADALKMIDQQTVSHALSETDQAVVMAALEIIRREYETGDEPLLVDFAVVAMGRQGGREIGYGSDLDAMFVYEARGDNNDEATRQATEIAKKLTQYIKMPVKPAIPMEQILVVDADLRPEGKRGPLVRSLESYQSYYDQWAEIWEVQALLRARTIAGNEELQEAFTDWVDTQRYHTDMTESKLMEIRRIKARVEAERLPRGADPTRQVKLGRGSLSDVEWLVQTYQLQYAADHEELQTTETLVALRALGELGYLEESEVETLAEAWTLSTRIRSANTVWNSRGSDTLPTNRDDLEAVARWCGYEPGQAGQLEDDYLRITRHSRHVFEHRFYGLEPKRTPF